MRFVLILVAALICSLALACQADQTDLLNSLGTFEEQGDAFLSTNLPKSWVVISSSSANQRLSIAPGNNSRNALLFTKTGTEHGLFHRIALKLENTTIPAGTVLTLSFDYYCKKGNNNLTGGLSIGISKDGGNRSGYEGNSNYIEGSATVLSENNIETDRWVNVSKKITTAESLRNPYIMICESYWEDRPYEIAIDNIRLLMDGKIVVKTTKMEKATISDSRLFSSSDWAQGEDSGAKQTMNISLKRTTGVEVTYEKEAGGGYCTLTKTFTKPLDLTDFKTICLDADFSKNTEHNIRNINNEGHSGIAFWIQDTSGKKAYYDIYSKVPLSKNKYRYYYLLEYPLGPFNGNPDRSRIASFGLQISKLQRPGKGGFAIDNIAAMLKADIGDSEIGAKYKQHITQLSQNHKPNMGSYFVIAGSANVKYHFTYVPDTKSIKKKQIIALSSAKQSTAHSQIVFIPSAASKNTRISLVVNGLKAARHSDTISSDRIKVFAVGHVPIKPNKISTDYAGWNPDIVFNSNQLTLTSNKSQSAWIQIDIPTGIAADTYRGKLDIVGVNKKVLYSIPIELKVWDFDLPAENKIRTSFWAFRGMVSRYLSKDNIDVEEIYPYYKLSLDHRLSPIDQNDGARALYKIYHEKDGSITLDTTEFEKYITYCKENSNGSFNAFNIAEHAWFGVTLQNGFTVYERETGELWKYDNSPFSAENKRIFKTVVDTLSEVAEKQGVLEYAYIQPFDEPSPNEPLFPRIISAMKEMNLRIPIEVVFAVNESIDYYPDMTKDIDIWTPSLYTLRESDIKYQHSRNKEIWSYVCTGGNMLVPNNPNHDRWFFLKNFAMGTDGFLNWGLNYWGNISSSAWKKGIYNGYGNYDNSAIGQGDGVLMYPDANASIRLKGLLRGVEDYQYAWMLRNIYNGVKDTPGGISMRSKVEELLSMEKLIQKVESGNAECIDIWREDVAKAILKLQK